MHVFPWEHGYPSDPSEPGYAEAGWAHVKVTRGFDDIPESDPEADLFSAIIWETLNGGVVTTPDVRVIPYRGDEPETHPCTLFTMDAVLSVHKGWPVPSVVE